MQHKQTIDTYLPLYIFTLKMSTTFYKYAFLAVSILIIICFIVMLGSLYRLRKTKEKMKIKRDENKDAKHYDWYRH